jgi:hypothetical protein
MCLVRAERMSALYDVPCLRNGGDSEGFSLRTKISTETGEFRYFYRENVFFPGVFILESYIINLNTRDR